VSLDHVSTTVDSYRLQDGIYLPPVPVVHRDEEYDSQFLPALRVMQRDHFWYRGRHRFLLHAVHRHVRGPRPPRVIDLGGGCGGWITFLDQRKRFPTSELALADSSQDALQFAAGLVPRAVRRYQIDLLNLQWADRWDVAFLLDVLEHIADQETALEEIHRALSPGGLLFVTVPAFDLFWTWNDDMVHHQRRYRRSDFARLASHAGFDLVDSRYFMFFLSPLLLASRRIASLRLDRLTELERRQFLEKMHRVPPLPINEALAAIFACETPAGHLVRFPFGSSLLAVLTKASREPWR
jgi:SAM-dependent methyltransferase